MSKSRKHHRRCAIVDFRAARRLAIGSEIYTGEKQRVAWPLRPLQRYIGAASRLPHRHFNRRRLRRRSALSHQRQIIIEKR